MARVPPYVAREVVLREFPRALRAGLCSRNRSAVVARELATEAGVLDPSLEGPLAGWIERGCALPSGELVLLDCFAVSQDSDAAREIGDALLMLASPPEDGEVARRLARTAWRAVHRLPEAGARLHQLALASAEAQAQEDDDEGDDTFVDLDALTSEAFPADRERRAAALLAWREALGEAFDALKVEARTLAVGLALVGVARSPGYVLDGTYSGLALAFGRDALGPVERIAAKRERARVERRSTPAMASKPDGNKAAEAERTPEPAVEEGHVVVCREVHVAGASRGRDVVRGYEHVIGKPIPRVETPDLTVVRGKLTAAFPYATEAVDRTLAHLVGRRWIKLPPILFLGPPGGGKSVFARALSEALQVGLYRVDGTGDGGVAFGGTERRWYSSEPCRPFMAIARHRQANVAMLIDEVDKCPVRNDYGSLLTSLITVMERETASRFPDPALQTEIDISHVSYLCTANGTLTLPGPLLDRLIVIPFPTPRAKHLDALLPALVADIAQETGVDPGFLPPLSGLERDALRRRWAGGSVRRLRKLVSGVLRARERVASKCLQ